MPKTKTKPQPSPASFAMPAPDAAKFLPELDAAQRAELLSDLELTSFVAAWCSENVLGEKSGNWHHLAAKILKESKINFGEHFAKRVALLVAENSKHHNKQIRLRLSVALSTMGVKDLSLPTPTNEKETNNV